MVIYTNGNLVQKISGTSQDRARFMRFDSNSRLAFVFFDRVDSDGINSSTYVSVINVDSGTIITTTASVPLTVISADFKQ